MTRRLVGAVVGWGLVGGCGFDTGGVGDPGMGELVDGSSSTAVDAVTSSAEGEGSGSASGGGVPTSSADGSEGSSDTGDASSTGETPMPCADDGGCDADASCAPDPSGEVAVCTCNAGFVGDGIDCAVVPQLAMLRVEAACDWGGAGVCAAGGDADQTMLVGEPGVVYRVTLRVRGVVELKTYSGGSQDGLWHPGGNPAPDLWNLATLSIAGGKATQAQSIRLNSGSSGAFSLTAVDITHDAFIEAGALVRLSIDPVDFTQIGNAADLVIPDIPPAPDAFDGQFLQIDAVAITPE